MDEIGYSADDSRIRSIANEQALMHLQIPIYATTEQGIESKKTLTASGL